MTFENGAAGLLLLLAFMLGLLVGFLRWWIWVKALEKAGKEAISAVHEFAGFMDGLACGPAESEMCRRCLPLAELIGYPIGKEEE